MEKQQQPKESVTIERTQEERIEQQPEPRRLRIETLENRVAPSAVWTD